MKGKEGKKREKNVFRVSGGRWGGHTKNSCAKDVILASLCASDHFVVALGELLKSVDRCEELISMQRSLGQDPKFPCQGDRETAKSSSEPLKCSGVRMWESGLTVPLAWRPLLVSA